MDVAVRELKAKLSMFLARAATGEVITVTDRGRPIATLGPLPGSVDLDAAVAQGWVTPATSSGLATIPRLTPTMSVQQALDADRAE